MKSAQEIKKALKDCDKAQDKDNPKLCPVWPKDDNLYCVDCTTFVGAAAQSTASCRNALRWVLTGDPDSKIK